MFLIFNNFIILNILLCNCAPLQNNNDVSTTRNTDFEHKVEMELSPIKCILKKVWDLLTNDELKFELAAVQGEVKKIIERAVKGDELLKGQGRFDEQKERIIISALKTFVVPYVCRNFELYEKVWDDGGKNSENFDPSDTKNTDVERHDLDTQTASNYKHHAKVWDRILTSSPHPLVQDFKRRIQSLYPKLSLQIVAKNLGLVHALLNNAKHGAINDEPEMVKLINPDDLIVALKGWGSLKDPVVLSIVKTFEQVISGL